jgi:hypothetical protein
MRDWCRILRYSDLTALRQGQRIGDPLRDFHSSATDLFTYPAHGPEISIRLPNSSQRSVDRRLLPTFVPSRSGITGQESTKPSSSCDNASAAEVCPLPPAPLPTFFRDGTHRTSTTHHKSTENGIGRLHDFPASVACGLSRNLIRGETSQSSMCRLNLGPLCPTSSPSPGMLSTGHGH